MSSNPERTDSETIVNENLSRAVEDLISVQMNQARSTVTTIASVAGGCINHAYRVDLSNGQRFFVKTNAASQASLFRAEVSGLQNLGRVSAIRVPQVLGCGSTGGTSYLVLEWIEEGSQASDFSQSMGRSLAHLHLNATNENFGFFDSNFLGTTPQPNRWQHDWVSFWAEQRLGFQLQLARDQKLGNEEMQRGGRELLNRLSELLVADDLRPALIHGDLWSGNYMSDSRGMPVFFDPAAYFAHREAEFGMTTLFGGFDAEFYAAYNEVWPLSPGSDTRIEIYRLYHLLNHLNLFGNSYLGGCLEILKKYAR